MAETHNASHRASLGGADGVLDPSAFNVLRARASVALSRGASAVDERTGERRPEPVLPMSLSLLRSALVRTPTTAARPPADRRQTLGVPRTRALSSDRHTLPPPSGQPTTAAPMPRHARASAPEYGAWDGAPPDPSWFPAKLEAVLHGPRRTRGAPRGPRPRVVTEWDVQQMATLESWGPPAAIAASHDPDAAADDARPGGHASGSHNGIDAIHNAHNAHNAPEYAVRPAIKAQYRGAPKKTNPPLGPGHYRPDYALTMRSSPAAGFGRLGRGGRQAAAAAAKAESDDGGGDGDSASEEDEPSPHRRGTGAAGSPGGESTAGGGHSSYKSGLSRTNSKPARDKAAAEAAKAEKAAAAAAAAEADGDPGDDRLQSAGPAGAKPPPAAAAHPTYFSRSRGHAPITASATGKGEFLYDVTAGEAHVRHRASMADFGRAKGHFATPSDAHALLAMATAPALSVSYAQVRGLPYRTKRRPRAGAHAGEFFAARPPTPSGAEPAAAGGFTDLRSRGAAAHFGRPKTVIVYDIEVEQVPAELDGDGDSEGGGAQAGLGTEEGTGASL